MLGTSRVITTNVGIVCYDADFYPYGGERTPYTNNCPATNNYKFEGKERDTETGNDDFGARYYSNRFGRWLSADWSAVPEPVPYANLSNPQTLNIYTMVSDDPESFADLDGHEVKEAPVKQVTYDVHGSSAEEARANALQSSGIKSSDGQAMMGDTNYTMSIDNVKYSVSASGGTPATGYTASSEVTDADVILKQTVTMPNWTDRDKASSEEQKKWDQAMADLKGHEDGHLEIDRQGAAELNKSLPGTSGYGQGNTQGDASKQATKQMFGAMTQKRKEATQRTRKRNDAYDTRTGHGAKPPADRLTNMQEKHKPPSVPMNNAGPSHTGGPS